MGSTTPNLALPYPVPADTVDVPRDVQALATKLDGITALVPPVVSALPGSPVDGQECYLLADVTAGTVWHLRYRAASPSTYKWEFLGGGESIAVVDTPESTSSTTFTNLATIGPTINIGLAGEYIVRGGCGAQASAGQNASIGLATAATPGAADQVTVTLSTAFTGVLYLARKLTVAAGGFVQMKYMTNAGSTTFSGRELTVYPLRVG
jgi:hypothetical protein